MSNVGLEPESLGDIHLDLFIMKKKRVFLMLEVVLVVVVVVV